MYEHVIDNIITMFHRSIEERVLLHGRRTVPEGRGCIPARRCQHHDVHTCRIWLRLRGRCPTCGDRRRSRNVNIMPDEVPFA